MKIKDTENLHSSNICGACGGQKGTTTIVCHKCFHSWYYEGNRFIPDYLVSVIQRKYYILRSCIKHNDQHRH